MALIPNFDRIVATVTASDIEKFLHSTAAEDDKQRVRDASSNELKKRLVGGYLIRTNQITPARLNPKPISSKLSKSTKPVKTAKASKAATVSTAADVTSASA